MSSDEKSTKSVNGTKTTVLDVDRIAEQDLHKLGYEQEMTRKRGLAHILFMTLAIMAVPYGLSGPFATGLIGGGPAVLIWGWLLVSVLTFAMALSLAEICSKYPTSAGAYYWCFRLANPHTRVLLSWINGWLTTVGVWTICLSVTFGTAQLLIAEIAMWHEEWEVTQWQTYLIFVGVTLIATALGILLNDVLPTVDILSAVWTLLGTLVLLICLAAKAESGRRSAGFALGHFDASASGWTPGWSFFIGLLPPAYTFSATGMIASMAEEVHDPSIQVPRAMVLSIPIGFLTGVFFLLPILFTLPDTATLLEVPSGQPIALMFRLVMGSRGGGFGVWFIVFVVAVFCAISICSAASRATWAFARDGAIPFHRFFARISWGLPVNAYMLSTLVQLLLGLIYLGSSTAFNAFVGVAVMCLQASYAMPVAISLWHGRRDFKGSEHRGEVGVQWEGRFSLGKFGWVINCIAVAWTAFEIVLFSMPPVVPVTKETMNYACVVFVGFGVLSAVWYVINGRFHYKGPPVDAAHGHVRSHHDAEKEPTEISKD